MASELMPARFLLGRYRFQISSTGTGGEGSSSGGSLGGRVAFLMFLKNERYHGSSTSAASSRCRWISGFMPSGPGELIGSYPPVRFLRSRKGSPIHRRKRIHWVAIDSSL